MLSISTEEKRVALRAARSAIVSYLNCGMVPEPSTRSPALLEHRGSFVTLRRRDTGELRGCRGECRALRPLIESVIQQALCSAIDDCRFPPVTAEEVAHLTIRISALTPLERTRPEAVALGRHGLVIVQGGRSGLLLPEVPAHYGLRTVDEFLNAIFRKARLDRAALAEDDVELYSFETEAWGDADVMEDSNGMEPDSKSVD